MPLRRTLVVDPKSVRDLAPDALAAPSRPRVLPAAFYRDTTMVERAVLCAKSVEKLDAAAAIANYPPQVVLASWVTHR